MAGLSARHFLFSGERMRKSDFIRTMFNSDLIAKILNGESRSIARAISLAENGGPSAADLMKGIFPRTGRAAVIGITGSPGAGKSSLVDKLALFYKEKGDK